MEKTSWKNRVRNEEVLHGVKEEKIILQSVHRRKANWTGHMSRRNCLLKHIIEGKVEGRIEVTGKPGTRRKEPLNDLKERKEIAGN